MPSKLKWKTIQTRYELQWSKNVLVKTAVSKKKVRSTYSMHIFNLFVAYSRIIEKIHSKL